MPRVTKTGSNTTFCCFIYMAISKYYLFRSSFVQVCDDPEHEWLNCVSFLLEGYNKTSLSGKQKRPSFELRPCFEFCELCGIFLRKTGSQCSSSQALDEQEKMDADSGFSCLGEKKGTRVKFYHNLCSINAQYVFLPPQKMAKRCKDNKARNNKI